MEIIEVHSKKELLAAIGTVHIENPCQIILIRKDGTRTRYTFTYTEDPITLRSIYSKKGYMSTIERRVQEIQKNLRKVHQRVFA